jgi:hypothetical protein
MPAAEKAGNMTVIADCLITRGVAALIEGRAHEATVLLSGAKTLAEEHGLVSQRMRAMINIASNYQQMHPAQALATARAGIEVAQQFGLGPELAIHVGNAIEAGVHLAAWEELRTTIAESAESTGDFGLVIRSIESIMQSLTGNLELAERCLEDFENFIGDSSSKQDQAEAAAARGALAFVRGDLDATMQAAAAEDAAGSTHILELLGISSSAAIWAGDIEAARARQKGLEDSILQNAWKDCRIKTLAAGIAMLEGDRDRSIQLHNEVFAQWDELQIPLGKAFCQMNFVMTVGGPETSAAAAEAATFFSDAGNTALVERIRRASAKG